MDFNRQINTIRKQHHLTQEEMATKLHVSWQTISSWETGRNLPDLETVVTIAEVFHVTLDTLILGDQTMQTKLIKDGNKTHRARLNLAAAVTFLIGIACFLFETFVAPSWIGSNGILHEPFFFLLPVGYLCLLVAIIILGFSIVHRLRHK
ncbi:transcriptional regulator [Secundilactobacillus paracollinoides]|uniref:helix-turn-helix domain-containing protein n=1 Tax=Secundilactobacillus paracollinoides TaxID=240427 RepID=UPI00081A91BC|nr:helix-turn-helix domain-containing protein [Secundilactobacillus paracollinoides]ANZ64987.1 transcriptional regulator [Secundilactobacillus paracollinoides]